MIGVSLFSAPIWRHSPSISAALATLTNSQGTDADAESHPHTNVDENAAMADTETG